MAYPFTLILTLSLAIAFTLYRLTPSHVTATFPWGVFLSLFWVQTLAYIVWSRLLYPIFFTPLRHLPQPPGASFFNGHFKRISAEPSGHPQADWIDNVPNDGLIYYRAILNTPRVLLTNAKALSEVLTTNSYDFVKPQQIRQNLGRLLGVGILLAEGDEHKRQRKLLSPAFSFRHIKDLYPHFWAKGQEMVLVMEKFISTPSPGNEKPSNVVEVGELVSRATLDIIGTTGMGKDFNSLADPSGELNSTYKKVFQSRFRSRILNMLSFVIPMKVLTLIPIKRNTDIREAVGTIKRTARNLIEEKKAKMEKGDSNDVDIISVALESGGFTDEELVNQLMTFLAAGHETTASSMSWAVYRLCLHPDIQTRLREEIKASGLPSVHDESKVATASDVENIPYLSAFCNEVLRVHAPVSLTLRKANRDTTILGHPIPKDTTVIIAPYAINNSKEMWGETAKEFNPERWMQPGCYNTGGAKSNYGYMTFLHGPRSCIGSAFAKAEFMCLIAAWVSSFETELEDPDRVVEIGGGVATRPLGGLPVKITPLKG